MPKQNLSPVPNEEITLSPLVLLLHDAAILRTQPIGIQMADGIAHALFGRRTPRQVAGRMIDAMDQPNLNRYAEPEPASGYDYTHQAWVVEGLYESCGLPEDQRCDCFACTHKGQQPLPDAEIH